MPAEGYITKTKILEVCRVRTGYGRRIVERKLDEMERIGDIHPLDDPGRINGKVYSKLDVEKVVAALTLPPVE